MKHEVTSLNTKRMLSASLKKFMRKKNLSKITVSEIVADCKVNRKTFYYHFADIYDLLKWTLEEEAIYTVKKIGLFANYKEALNFIIDYITENQHILSCAYDSMGREEMKRFFYDDFVSVMRTLIDDVANDLGKKVSVNYREFVCRFYTEAVTGMIINWVTDRADGDKEKIIQYLTKIYQSSLTEVIKNAPED